MEVNCFWSAIHPNPMASPSADAYSSIKRYELTGNQAVLSIQNLSAGMPLCIRYYLRACFPLKGQPELITVK
jgi:hypothetical protein